MAPLQMTAYFFIYLEGADVYFSSVVFFNVYQVYFLFIGCIYLHIYGIFLWYVYEHFIVFFFEVGKKHLRIHKSISIFHLTHMRNRVRDHPAMIPRITRYSPNSDAKNSEFIVRCVSSRRPERECSFTR